MKTTQTTLHREKVLLVGFGLRRRRPPVPGIETDSIVRESLEELAELARGAGGEVAGTMMQIHDAADPATPRTKLPDGVSRRRQGTSGIPCVEEMRTRS